MFVSNKRCNSAGFRNFTFDPSNPSPTIGGANLDTKFGNDHPLPPSPLLSVHTLQFFHHLTTHPPPATGVGPYDQRPIAQRDDVMSYTTPVLPTTLVISGPVSARITLVLDQPDADIVLRLCDVYPDGRLMLMMEGHVRVAAALGNYSEAVLAVPGDAYTVDVDLGHISLAVNAGHRLALLLTASNYPKLLVNPNDGSAPLSQHHDPRPVTVAVSDDSYVKVYVDDSYVKVYVQDGSE